MGRIAHSLDRAATPRSHTPHRAALWQYSPGRECQDGHQRASCLLATAAVRPPGRLGLGLSGDLLSRVGHRARASVRVLRDRSREAPVPERPRAGELLLLQLRQRRHHVRARGGGPHRTVLVPDPPRPLRQRTPSAIRAFCRLRGWRRVSGATPIDAEPAQEVTINRVVRRRLKPGSPARPTSRRRERARPAPTRRPAGRRADSDPAPGSRDRC